MNDHDKWLSRRLYHEMFSTEGSAFPNWRGLPNRCTCGCESVWYDRVSPVNWWTYFTPKLLKQVNFLFPIFRSFYAVVWSLPPVIWIWFTLLRTYCKPESLVANIDPNVNARFVVIIVRLFLYGFIAPLVLVLWATTWVLSRLGGITIFILHVVSLALLSIFMVVSAGVAGLVIAMRGLVFVIGGAASVLYSYYPAVGVSLIVVGVLVEYERNRRADRRREEQLGYLILRANSIDSPQSTEVR